MTQQDLCEMYLSDPEFVAAYHGNYGWSAEQCAEDSWANIKDLELHMFDFGYIAVNKYDLVDRLAGFFIKPSYRNKEGKAKFLDEIDRLLPKVFVSCIHSSNQKAIRFLTSVCKIVKSDNITTYLVSNREN